MTIDLNIVNGTLFLFDGLKQGGVAIEGDRIIKIGKEPSLPKSSITINANGALVIPGLIDIHVHLRDLEQAKKETLETGLRSAIAGGVTTVLDMPNNIPPTNSESRIKNKKQLIEGKAAANIGFYSLLPKTLEELEHIIATGIFGFKIYPAEELYPPKNNTLLNDFLRIIAKYNIPLIIHPDNGYASNYEKELFNSELPKIDAFIKAHNQIDEAKALEYFLSFKRNNNFHLHCAHVTAKETVEVLSKNNEVKELTSEVCPHHLFLTIDDLKKQGSKAKCLPPLRTKEDQKALWNALNDNIINIIATDHAPHTHEEKYCEFEQAAAGIHGLETLAPLMFTAAGKGLIDIENLISKLTLNPAKYAKIPFRGKLKENYFADIVIMKKEKGKIDAELFESKAKWTPFDGYSYSYYPHQVIVNGILTKDGEHVISKAQSGRILTRKSDNNIDIN